jgi:hypothetical protein
MCENILAVLPADKAKPLGIVKPLHCSLFHVVFLLHTELTLGPIGARTVQLLQKTNLFNRQLKASMLDCPSTKSMACRSASTLTEVFGWMWPLPLVRLSVVCHVARPHSATRQIILKNYATYRSKLQALTFPYCNGRRRPRPASPVSLS